MSTAATHRSEIDHAPKRKDPFGKTSPIVYHIEVDPKTYASTVSLTPAIVAFIDGDFVQFTSNSAESAIRFVENSPFDAPANAGQVFRVGRTSQTLPVVKLEGTTHFQCGYIDKDGNFEQWPGGGSDTPGGGHGSR